MPNSRWHVRQRDEAEAVVSVQEAVDDFLASAEVRSLQPKTQSEYASNLNTFAWWCAGHALIQNKTDKTWKAVKADSRHPGLALHQINDQAVHFFLEYLKATRQPSQRKKREGGETISTYTTNQYVKNIKRFLNWCILDDLYTEHVQPHVQMKIKKPRIEHTIIEVFTSEQIDALFAACNKEESEHLQLRDRAILSVLLDSGLRAMELVTLTIANVSLDTKDAHVRVYGKGKKWGEVGLGEQARRAVQKYYRIFREPTCEHELKLKEKQYSRLPMREQQQRKRQYLSEQRMFVNRAGDPLTKSGLYQIITRLGEWAGIEGVRCSPHTFRHTFSAMFMRNGGDIYTLSRLLRHSSVKVTEEYLKALRQSEARRNAKSVLDHL